LLAPNFDCGIFPVPTGYADCGFLALLFYIFLALRQLELASQDTDFYRQSLFDWLTAICFQEQLSIKEVNFVKNETANKTETV
jgi:hypothetical protein